MSALPKKKLTEAEYLAIEEAAEFKSEFYNGEMFAMAGTKYAHVQINANLLRKIGNQLEGGSCQVLANDLRVKVSRSGLYTYPDLLIVCGKPVFQKGKSTDTLLNPSVIIEILSPSTDGYDRGRKFETYKQIESLQEYVLVAQDKPVCERHVRQPDNSWLEISTTGLKKELKFATVPVLVPLAEIYSGVTFPKIPEKPPR